MASSDCVSDLQSTTRDPGKSKPASVLSICYLVHSRRKLFTVLRFQSEPVQHLEESFDALGLERRAVKAGNYLTPLYCFSYVHVRNRAVFKIFFSEFRRIKCNIVDKALRERILTGNAAEVRHSAAELRIHFCCDIFFRSDSDVHFIDEYANRDAPFAEHLVKCPGMRLNSLRSADNKKRIVND